MTAATYDRPGPGEFVPYQELYVRRVPDGDVVSELEAQIDRFDRLLGGLPESKGNHAYAVGKWSIKEVLGHLIDAERVFCYRALSFARGDSGPLSSFDENAWIGPAGFGARTLADLLAEWKSLRRATVAFFRHLPQDAVARTGSAAGHPVSVRALAYVIAGHATHHEGVLAERYL